MATKSTAVKKSMTPPVGPQAVYTPEELTAAVRRSEVALTGHGFSIKDPGVSATEVKLLLGEAGLTTVGDSTLFPFILRLAGGQSASASLEAAVLRSSVEPLMAKLRQGWSELSSDGTRQFLLGLDLDADSMPGPTGATALACVAARRATNESGKAVARLLSGEAVVAPSRVQGSDYERVSGRAGVLTVISISELAGLGVLIDELAVTRDPRSNLIYDLREQSLRCNAARDDFNRNGRDSASLAALALAGWEVVDTSETPDRAQVFAPSGTYPIGVLGGTYLPAGTVAIIETGRTDEGADYDPTTQPGGTGVLSAGTWRPFELFAKLSGKSYEDFAEDLLQTGAAKVPTAVFQATSVVLVETEQPQLAKATMIVNALKNAKAKSDPSIPLAIRRITPAGVTLGIVSTTPDGRLATHTGVTSLMFGSAQMVNFAEDANIAGDRRVRRYEDGFSVPIREAVEAGVLSAGVLAEAAYIGTEPTLLPNGDVVAEHGYFPGRHSALVTIPERERRAWRDRFSVKRADLITLADAQAASEWIFSEVLGDFPYSTPGDAARGLMYLLTASSRGVLNQSVAFIFNGAEVGSGKTKHAKIGRIISVGVGTATSFVGSALKDEENVKARNTCIKAGGRFMHLDEGAQGGMLTSIVLSDGVSNLDGDDSSRMLGGNDMQEVAGLVYTIAGNGVVIAAELGRRVRKIDLIIVGGVLAVNRTNFKHNDLEGWCLAHRPEILSRLYTIMSYSLARQDPKFPKSGFNGTFPLILEALSHLTIGGENAYKLAEDKTQAQLSTGAESEDWSMTEKLFTLTAGTAFSSRTARRFAAANPETMPLPPELAVIKMGAFVGQDKAWTSRLNKRDSRKVTIGDFVYRFEVIPKANNGQATTYRLERFAISGEAAPATWEATAPLVEEPTLTEQNDDASNF